MGYVKFTKSRRPEKGQPMITILKGGQLGINRACMDQYFKNYKYALMYYDAEQKKIGIKPTNDGTQDAYNIRLTKGGKLANISAIAFLKHFGIDHKQSRAYIAIWNEAEKLVEFSLN